MAEIANESAVVVAAFMLESMEYYHKNRDVALSYLARLESGYRAKIENPELAAAFDSEAKAKVEADELFQTFETDPGSSGGAYIQQVKDFMRSSGYYDSLVSPAQRHSDFLRAAANVYVAGYQTSSSPKVVGALITDGANKYKSDPSVGVTFLNKVATNMRKRHDEHLSIGNELSRTAPPAEMADSPTSLMRTYMSEDQRIEEEAADYHAALDLGAKNSLRFIIDNGFFASEQHTKGEQKLYAELLLYLATFNARNLTRTEIHTGTWNTFKRSVEVRMLGVCDDGHHPSGIFNTQDGEQVFAHLPSTYWQRMDALERVLNRHGTTGLIQHLLNDMGGGTGNEEQFIAYFTEVVYKV